MEISIAQAKKPYLILGLLLLGPIAFAIAVLGLWLSRGDWIYPDQPQAASLLEDLGSVTVGQTFVADQAGLQAIEVKLNLPHDHAAETLILHLQASPDSTGDLRRATVTVGESKAGEWLRFSFDPLPNSRSNYYYFFIEATGNTSNNGAAIYYGPPEAYLDGAMYLKGQPQEGQLAFRAVYNRPAMLQDLLEGIVASIPGGVMVALALFTPGWALLALLQRQKAISLHWLEGAAVAAALSLAFYPILFLLTNAARLNLGASYLWGTVVAGAIVLLWHYRPWQWQWKTMLSGLEIWLQSDAFWADGAVIVLLLLALGGRFLMIRGLDMPLWDDAAHHTVVTKRIMESGGLFQSWMPYAPYSTFSFHFGFHVNSAIFGWASGLDAPQAVLWGGQLFNVVAVFALYPLAYRLKGVWAGVIAVLAAGFFTRLPLYYTNWGRYPQLMGQAILPVAAWWTWITLQDARRKYKNILWILSGALLITGAILGYYRMVFHYLAFVITALFICIQRPQDLFNWQRWLALFAAAVATLLLLFPWFNKLFARFLGPAVRQPVNQPEAIGLWDKIETMSALWFAPQVLVVLLGVLAIVWWGRKAALPTLWLLLLVSLPVLTATSLPGAGIIQQFTIETSLYLPMALIWAVLGGFLLSDYLTKHWQWSGVFALLLIAAALYKFPEMPATLDREFDLSGRPDLLAAAWINQNTPEDAFFLINGIVYTDGYSAIAGDAGTWLPVLTGRGVTIPPQYALLAEVPLAAGYSDAVNNLTAQLFEVSPTTARGKKIICNFPTPITHVYLGQQRGTVDKAIAPPPRPMLPARALLRDPAFELIHQQDRAMIFEFDRSVCAQLD